MGILSTRSKGNTICVFRIVKLPYTFECCYHNSSISIPSRKRKIKANNLNSNLQFRYKFYKKIQKLYSPMEYSNRAFAVFPDKSFSYRHRRPIQAIRAVRRLPNSDRQVKNRLDKCAQMLTSRKSELAFH